MLLLFFQIALAEWEDEFQAWKNSPAGRRHKGSASGFRDVPEAPVPPVKPTKPHALPTCIGADRGCVLALDAVKPYNLTSIKLTLGGHTIDALEDVNPSHTVWKRESHFDTCQGENLLFFQECMKSFFRYHLKMGHVSTPWSNFVDYGLFKTGKNKK